MTFQKIDFLTWPRREYFLFYQQAAQPWFNICNDLDVTRLRNYCRENGLSFYYAYLYLMQVCINNNEAFKIRVVQEQVRAYKNIGVSVACLAEDELMRFCEIPYCHNFGEFCTNAKEAELGAKSAPFIASNFIGKDISQNVVHVSVIPWITFTSFSHAQCVTHSDSIPKIVFGKVTNKEGKYIIPLSVAVHHGIMDGLHVGRFVEQLEYMFSKPELYLS